MRLSKVAILSAILAVALATTIAAFAKVDASAAFFQGPVWVVVLSFAGATGTIIGTLHADPLRPIRSVAAPALGTLVSHSTFFLVGVAFGIQNPLGTRTLFVSFVIISAVVFSGFSVLYGVAATFLKD